MVKEVEEHSKEGNECRTSSSSSMANPRPRSLGVARADKRAVKGQVTAREEWSGSKQMETKMDKQRQTRIFGRDGGSLFQPGL